MKQHFITPSNTIKENRKFLENLKKFSRSRSKIAKLILGASNSELFSLVEICFNILKGRLPLREKQIKRLKSRANLIRKMARTRSSKSARKILLNDNGQTGAGLPMIASLLASLLLPAISEKLMK